MAKRAVALVSVRVEKGRMKETTLEAAEVLRINPQFSAERWSRTVPFKEQSEVDRYSSSLRTAGLR